MTRRTKLSLKVAGLVALVGVAAGATLLQQRSTMGPTLEDRVDAIVRVGMTRADAIRALERAQIPHEIRTMDTAQPYEFIWIPIPHGPPGLLETVDYAANLGWIDGDKVAVTVMFDDAGIVTEVD